MVIILEGCKRGTISYAQRCGNGRGYKDVLLKILMFSLVAERCYSFSNPLSSDFHNAIIFEKFKKRYNVHMPSVLMASF